MTFKVCGILIVLSWQLDKFGPVTQSLSMSAPIPTRILYDRGTNVWNNNMSVLLGGSYVAMVQLVTLVTNILLLISLFYSGVA